MNPSPFRIVLFGVGTVGAAVLRILQQQHNCGIEIAAVVSREAKQRLQQEAPQYLEELAPQQIFNSWDELHECLKIRPQTIGRIHAVIELIGGIAHCLEIYRYFLMRQIPVVTANKALLAECGSELFPLAQQNQTFIAGEASCGGGIPILQSLLTSLRANRIHEFHGVFNGTCNYILWQMAKEGRNYQDVLAEAQAIGLAEADPFLDVSGTDTAHKLAILAMMSFGKSLHMNQIPILGLDTVSKLQIAAAQRLGGLHLKLLGSAWMLEEGSSPISIALRVGPCFVASSEQQFANKVQLSASPLASLSESFNGVSFYGNNVGHVYLQGRGAGASATASAVLSDLYQIQNASYAAIFHNFANWPAASKFSQSNAWPKLAQNWLGFIRESLFTSLKQQSEQLQISCDFLLSMQGQAVVLLTQVSAEQLEQCLAANQMDVVPILQTTQERLDGENFIRNA